MCWLFITSEYIQYVINNCCFNCKLLAAFIKLKFMLFYFKLQYDNIVSAITMAKNLENAQYGRNVEEIQQSTSNGWSNYEKLLEKAVEAQKTLREFENIQFKLKNKIENLNNQISTQQSILNGLFQQ